MRRRISFLSWLGLPYVCLNLKASAQQNVSFTSVFDGNAVDGRPFLVTWDRLSADSYSSINLTQYVPAPEGFVPLLQMLTDFGQYGGHLTWTPRWEADKYMYRMSGIERDEANMYEKNFESEPFRIQSQGSLGSYPTQTSTNTKKTLTIPQSAIITNRVGFPPNSITTITKAPSSGVSAILTTATSISTTETLTGNFVEQASTTASSLPSEGVTSNTNTLNRSAKIGIGFGATIAFLAFTFILAFFFFRYGRRVAIENKISQDSPPEIAPPALRLDFTRPPSCRIETIQPFELWSPSADDLQKRGSAELEGWTGNGLIDTEKGRRAEIDGMEKIKRGGSMSGSSKGAKRKSEVGSWLLSWGRWVERV